jgi:hypothetical protein
MDIPHGTNTKTDAKRARKIVLAQPGHARQVITTKRLRKVSVDIRTHEPLQTRREPAGRTRRTPARARVPLQFVRPATGEHASPLEHPDCIASRVRGFPRSQLPINVRVVAGPSSRHTPHNKTPERVYSTLMEPQLTDSGRGTSPPARSGSYTQPLGAVFPNPSRPWSPEFQHSLWRRPGSGCTP